MHHVNNDIAIKHDDHDYEDYTAEDGVKLTGVCRPKCSSVVVFEQRARQRESAACCAREEPDLRQVFAI